MLRFAGRDTTRLLQTGDPEPVEWINSAGPSPIFLTCEHAGRAVPQALGDLAIPAEEMERHIAYDVGAEGVARGLAERLDAALILQRYSRLVIDCNRPLEAKDCIVTQSDGTVVPVNAAIADLDRSRRYVEIHQPLHEAIAVALDQRQAMGKPLVLVSVRQGLSGISSSACSTIATPVLPKDWRRLSAPPIRTSPSSSTRRITSTTSPITPSPCTANGAAFRMCLSKCATTLSPMPADKRNGRTVSPAPSASRQTESKEKPDGH
jgi:hypothetical protein